MKAIIRHCYNDDDNYILPYSLVFVDRNLCSSWYTNRLYYTDLAPMSAKVYNSK